MNATIVLGKKYHCKSESETEFFAFGIASNIKPPYVLYLKGDLGVGKTYFARMICKYYGLPEVKSSSFAKVSSLQGKINLIHCDLYRKRPDINFYEEEVEPLLIDPWVLIIEWGVEGDWDFGCPEYVIQSEYLGMHERHFTILEH
jgi:tRNA threonylcarbamoyladenosine biosynthesis protein TsaE